jgi:hypothetical protein
MSDFNQPLIILKKKKFVHLNSTFYYIFDCHIIII